MSKKEQVKKDPITNNKSRADSFHSPGDPSKVEREGRFQGNHLYGDSTRRNQGESGNRYDVEEVSPESYSPKTMIGERVSDTKGKRSPLSKNSSK